MGGIGSGRRPSHIGKDKTEDSMPLDIRRLHRAGALSLGRCVSWQWTVNNWEIASIRVHAYPGSVTLDYNYTPRGRPGEVISQSVWLETTPCALGGIRSWFTCPTCRKRVAVIYCAVRLFACRQCNRLAYSSQSEAADDRAARRADQLRKKLGWEPGILNGPGLKPKRMHWRTYERILARHDSFVGLSLAGMAANLGLISGRLDDIEDSASTSR